MLSQLYIKNIAVISEATIDFGPRFNVFTGETGAGKTILVSAINGVLGARLSKEIIRSGEESAYLSALFTGLSPQICKQVQELGFEMDDDILLICPLSEEQKIKQYVNEVKTNFGDKYL